MASKFLVALVHATALKVELGIVWAGVFNRVTVQILIDLITTIVSATQAHSFHRPHPFHPATFVDIVNIKITVYPTTKPEKAMKVFDLIKQITNVFVLCFLLSLVPSNESALHPHSPEVQEFS